MQLKIQELKKTNLSPSEEINTIELNNSKKRIIPNLAVIIAQMKMNRAKITLLQASDYWEV